MNPEQSEITELETIIADAFENRDSVNIETTGEIRVAVDKTLELLDRGIVRVAEPPKNG